MAKSAFRLLVLLAVAVAVSCSDDDSPNGVGPSATVTQVGAAPTQPLPTSPFPGPNNPAAPGSPPAPNSPPAPIYPVFGSVNSLSGVCPVLRFTISGRVIVTSRSTVFRGVSCPAFRSNVRVRVHGSVRSDGTMVATAVEPN